MTLQAGLEQEIYPFRAKYGFGQYTYSLPPETEGFKIDGGTGVLSTDKDQVSAGAYQVTVRVEDEDGSRAQSIINVELLAFALADAPPLFAIGRLPVAVSLHAFTDSRHGVGAYTYDLVNDAGDFILGAESGVLSVQANVAVGVYTVLVAARDAGDNRATAVATVRLAQNGIFMLGGENGTNRLKDVWAAVDGKNWVKVADAPWPKRKWHQAVGYQGRLYVLGGNDGGRKNDIWSSADGKTWRRDKANDEQGWSKRHLFQAVVHQERLYVLGGYAGGGSPIRKNDVWSWAKGESSWSAVTLMAAWTARNGLQAVSHNGRLYVLGGADTNTSDGQTNDVWSSVDGANWSFEGNADWSVRALHQAVSHNGRLYVLGGTDGTKRNDVWSWAEGESGWTPVKANNTSFWSGRSRFGALSRDGLLYVMGGSDADGDKNDVWSSADGVSWTKVADANWQIRSGFQAVVFPPNLVLSGTSETITLTLQAGLEQEIYTFSAQGGRAPYTYSLPPETEGFKIDGGTGVLSTDKDQVSAGVYQVTVRVEDEDGSRAESIININLLSFVLVDAPPLFAIGRLPVAVSLHAFTDSYRGIGAYTYDLVDDAGYFTLGEASGVLSVRANVAVGVYTVLVAASDAGDNRATAVATVRLAKNGIFMMGGFSGAYINDVWAAVDGKNWVKVADADWPVRAWHQAVAHQERLYVLGGYDGDLQNDVWSSADGKNWTPEAELAWEARHRFQAVAHQRRLYVLGGSSGNGDLKNDVWSWAEGESSWTEVTMAAAWPARNAHQAVSHNGRLYVLGGGWAATAGTYRNDVWSSVDGANWLFEGNAEWGGRVLHQAVSHNGRLYVLGGVDGNSPTNRRNDVWSWAEGESWSMEKADNNNFWTKRSSFKALSHDGLLYVMGGLDKDDIFQNDVWSSADGVSWTKVTNANWPARNGLQALVFPPNLVLSGTSQTIILTLQAGQGLEIYPFIAQGGFGQYTYSLPPETEGFKIDGGTGVLSADNGQVSAGTYQVTVRVEDEDGSRAESIINIELRSFVLADVPPLLAIGRLPVAARVHAFTGQHGVGASTYDLVDDSGYFTLGDASGVLSVQANVAVGVYTVSVAARDERSNQATAVATVRLAKNGFFMMGGGDGDNNRNDVWAAADGKNWVKVANAGWSKRTWHQAVEYQGRLYVLGGYGSSNIKDMWSSADGKTWSREATPAWSARRQHQAVVHQGRLYVLGGLGSSRKNDVWSWAEGESWSLVTGAAAWPARNSHQAVSHNGRIYVLGGTINPRSGGRKDVWSSVDGANWSFEGNAAWPARLLHQAVSHNGRIYVLGGNVVQRPPQ